MAKSVIDEIFGNSVGDSLFILGDVVLGYTEIPNNFTFGGEQLQEVLQLPGGARIVNVLGRSDAEITFSGLFWGENATERARALDFLRVQGEEIEFVFGEFIYLVVIKEYKPILEKFYQVPYNITLTVVKDLTLPVPFPAGNSYNSAVNKDIQNILNLLDGVNSDILSASINNLVNSINDAGNLSTASQEALFKIKENIGISQGICNSLISNNELNN